MLASDKHWSVICPDITAADLRFCLLNYLNKKHNWKVGGGAISLEAEIAATAMTDYCLDAAIN